MVWGNNIGEINSISVNDLHEYMSRPTLPVLEFLESNKRPIIIYGATGKYMADFTEMVLRGIQQARSDSSGNVHLVSRFSNPERVQSRFERYNDLFRVKELDATKMTGQDLMDIPKEALVFYGIGYKFRQGNTSNEEYSRLCFLYGNNIPFTIFSHHRNDSVVVVMGSGNGLKPVPLDKPPT